jgi:tetratricopeptide (TPR) repeat protein
MLIMRQQYEEALPLFDAELKLCPSPTDKAHVLFAKGRFLEDQMGRASDAQTAYLAALDFDRENVQVLKALEQCAWAAEQWDSLHATYEKLANRLQSDTGYRAAVLTAQAQSIEHLSPSSESVNQLYEISLSLDPHGSHVLEALKRLYHKQSRWRELIHVLEREVAMDANRADRGDRTYRAMVLYRIARLYADKLGQRDESIATLERAAHESERDPFLLRELARLLEESSQTERLVQVLERLVDSIMDENELVGTLHRLGHLYEEKIRDDERAVSWYERVLEIAPAYLPALQSLGALYTRRGEWEALARMHMAESDATTDPKRRAAACVRVAEIMESRLQRIDEAIQLYTRAMTFAPGYVSAFRALTRLYTETNRWKELVQLYCTMVDQILTAPRVDRERAVTYLFKAGSLYEDFLDDPSSAALMYRKILTIDHKNLGAIHALERALERAGKHQELVEALELEAELSVSANEIAPLLHRAGELLEEELSNREGALARYRKALDVDPSFIPAVQSLGRLYHRLGRWEDVYYTYQRELELAPQNESTASMLFKMGELCEQRLGRDEEALECYRKAVTLDAEHTPSIQALVRKLTQKERWQELVDVLELELKSIHDPRARADANRRIGEIYEEELREPVRAILFYERCLHEMPEYRPAMDAISRLRTETHDWKTLVDSLAREASVGGDSAHAVSAIYRQGVVWRDKLGDLRRATLSFESVLSREPRHIGAMLALEPLYRALHQWESLAKLYATESEVFQDPAAKITALKEWARVLERKAEVDIEELKQAYDQVLELDPDDHEALMSLEKLAIETHDLPRLARIDERLAAQCREGVHAAIYYTRLGETLEALGRPDALQAYQAALMQHAFNLAAARGLVRVAQSQNNFEAVAEGLYRQAHSVRSKEISATLLRRSAMVHLEKLLDRNKALQLLEQALELNPDDEQSANVLSELLIASGHVSRLLDQLIKAFSRTTRPDRIAGLGLHVARLQAELFESVPAALQTLEKVLRASPNDLEATKKMAELYAKNRQWEQSAELWDRVAKQASDIDLRVEALVQLGRILETHLGDTAKARSCLESAVALDPQHLQALEQLADMHLRDGDVVRGITALNHLVQAYDSADPRLASTLVRLAHAERTSGNDEAFMGALLRAVASEGPGGRAALEYKQVASSKHHWERYDDALRRYLHGALQDIVAVGAVTSEIAWVQEHQLQSPEGAIQALREGMALSKDDPHIRLQLAQLLARSHRNTEALHEVYSVITKDFTYSEAWRELSRMFEQLGRNNDSSRALEPLHVLGVANPDEQTRIQQRQQRKAWPDEGSLDAEMLRQVEAPSHGYGPAERLLVAISEGLSKLYPPDLEGYGLSHRDRLTAKTPNAFFQLAEQVANCFSVSSYELYVHSLRSKIISIELSAAPSLLVPSYFPELPEAHQVFALSRVFANIKRGFHAVNKLTPREIEVLLAAAGRIVDPRFGEGLTSEDFLEEQCRRLKSAISRKSRKLVEDAATEYVASQPIDFGLWAHHVDQTAARAGLLVTDNLIASLEMLRKSERDALQSAATMSFSPVVRDLILFWVSEQATTARRVTGVFR